MKHVVFAVMIGLGTLALTHQSHAAACANASTERDASDPMARRSSVSRPPPNLRSPAPRGSTGRDAPDRMGPRLSVGLTSAVGSGHPRVPTSGPAALMLLMIGALGLVGILL